MIRVSNAIDLGRDKTRMKDPWDALRQKTTAQEILNRFFAPRTSKRFELQVLADEVGMGKTYVALAAAYSILEAMREGRADSDLDGCYQRILIITPQNQALFQKWTQEVGEFNKRCIQPDLESSGTRFRAKSVVRLDELAAELRKPGQQPEVIVTHTGMLQGSRLRDYDLKRRFLLGILFRYWGNAFQRDLRWRLLLGAPEGWPSNPDNLTELTGEEKDLLWFEEDEIYAALVRAGDMSEQASKLSNLLSDCRDIAQPFVRDRDERFGEVEKQLVSLYKSITGLLILRDFPLVIVDEVHNWKNGPSGGANGYNEFVDVIACRSRRALLLTATPFQLRPEELVEILRISDHMEPCPTNIASAERRESLQAFRNEVIQPALSNSAKASRRFTKEWDRLPVTLKKEEVTSIWDSSDLQAARMVLTSQMEQHSKIDAGTLVKGIISHLAAIDPGIRLFFQEALCLFAYNQFLSTQLGKLVLRHRRHTEHRLFKIGAELSRTSAELKKRGDSHILHAAPGLDVRGSGELPHYILMRCVSEMKRLQGRKGRSSLGSALTGCYSTIKHSAEGHQVSKWLKESPTSKVYLDILMSMVGEGEDPEHPKVARIVEEVLEGWKRGEKSLVFCFRINTAERLRTIIDERIRKELESVQKRCLGGEKKLKTLQGRLTGKGRDLIVIALDRTFLSMLLAAGVKSIGADELRLNESDVHALARLSLKYDVEMEGDRVDRVFLFRAIEHTVATRLASRIFWPNEYEVAFKDLLSETWISHPYGLETSDEDDGSSEEKPSFDERGAGTVYEMKDEPAKSDVENLARRLSETQQRANKGPGMSVLDHYFSYPSLWFGQRPVSIFTGDYPDDTTLQRIREIHRHLWTLSLPASDWEGWESRRKTLQAMRTSVLRTSVLVRLLPERADLDEGGWGELLVRTFFAPLGDQRESMADRVSVFLEDLASSSGSLALQDKDEGGLRLALFEATRLRDQKFVALVKGGGGGKGNEARNRVFAGFNTPLLPEVLVCTSVGQEGIDLHRHCRHVIHYDLAWNPAVLEQRTGRADRIGSKTFRERELALDSEKPCLEIVVPYLAGTYDERMYEELRLRAQMFEVLTGGDLASENRDGLSSENEDEGSESGFALLSLPEKMVADLRVNLHVWNKP
jgi:hypothetical protein